MKAKITDNDGTTERELPYLAVADFEDDQVILLVSEDMFSDTFRRYTVLAFKSGKVADIGMHDEVWAGARVYNGNVLLSND